MCSKVLPGELFRHGNNEGEKYSYRYIKNNDDVYLYVSFKQILRIFKENYNKILTNEASIYLSALTQYLLDEITELAGNETRSKKE